MQYKGEDLDLRVPHARASRDSYAPDYEASSGNGRWARSNPYPLSDSQPLWVDETLLACCNYAFDVAQANGAAEVDLEHLVNALTRVDAASRILEHRGVREGQLRRESAALIASEIPAANAGGAIPPRRSGDFEDVLRNASEIGRRRGSPATVDDVLWVLLHHGRDLSVLKLLRRLTPGWQRADWGRANDYSAPEPQSRPVQLLPNESVQARMASLEDSLRAMQVDLVNERKLLVELVRDIQRDVVAQRGDGAALRADLSHRLDGVERAVQVRGDGGRAVGQMADRLASLEKAIHGGLGDANRSTGQVGQRLAALETSLSEVRGASDGSATADRMATLEKAVHSGLGEGARNWSNLGQRLASLERAVSARGDGPLGERLDALERLVQASQSEANRQWSNLGQRFVGFERLISDGTTAAAPTAILERLGAIEKRLEAVGATAQTEISRFIEANAGEQGKARSELASRLDAIETYLAGLPGDSSVKSDGEWTERFGGLEKAIRSGFGEVGSNTGQLAQRVAGLERAMSERPRDDSEALLILDDRLGAIERMLDDRGQQALASGTQIAERLQLLEQRSAAPAPASLDTDALLASLTSNLDTRLQATGSTATASVEAVRSSVTEVLSRIGGLEERIRAEAVVTEEALRGRDQDFDFIYNEIKELGQSQATLNSAVNDWRNESQTHFGTLADRLDKVQAAVVLPERADNGQPFELPAVVKARNGSGGTPEAETVSHHGRSNGYGSVDSPAAGKGQADTRVVADEIVLPPQPGRGFWYWLFGTDNLKTANRDNDLKLGRMRRNIRDARDRRRSTTEA